jgi:hypothetical protein
MPGEGQLLSLPSIERPANPDLIAILRALLVTAPVAAVAVWRDTVSLFRYPFPVGVDGFYYAQQIKSILTNGTLYYPSRTPLVFYLIASVCGRHRDIVKCIKITSIGIEVLLFLAFWLLLWQLTRTWWITWWGTAVMAVLPSHLFLLADFTKELLCFALLAWSAVCGHTALIGHRHWLYGVASILFLLAVLSHVAALLILAVLLAAVGLQQLSIKHHYFLGIVIFLAWCTPILLSFLHNPSNIHLPLGGTTWWTAERLAILVTSTVILAVHTEKLESRNFSVPVFQTIALIALCVIANPVLDQNSDFVFGRASMTTNLQLGLLVAGLLYSRPRVYATEFLWPTYAVVAGCVCLSITSPIQIRGLDGAYLSRRAQLVDTLHRTPGVDQHAIVIAPQGDQFAVTYVTGLRSQHRWTTGFGSPIYWLLYGATTSRTPSMNTYSPYVARGYVVQSDISLRNEWEAYGDGARRTLIENNPELLVAGYDY